MRPLAWSALLLAAAAALHISVSLPQRRAAGDVGEQYEGVRRARQEQRVRASQADRERAALERAAATLALPPTGGDLVGALRRSVIGTLRSAPVSGVRVAVIPSGDAATVRVSAEGSFPAVLRLTGDLVRPRGGLVLQTVHLAPRGAGLGVEVQAMGLEAAR